MGFTLEAATVLEGGRANGEGVFIPAHALLGANDDSARDHLFMVQKRSYKGAHQSICCNLNVPAVVAKDVNSGAGG